MRSIGITIVVILSVAVLQVNIAFFYLGTLLNSYGSSQVGVYIEKIATA